MLWIVFQQFEPLVGADAKFLAEGQRTTSKNQTPLDASLRSE